MRYNKIVALAIAILICSTSALYAKHPHHHDRDETKKDNANYGKNIFSIAPLAITDNGVAIGLTYERVLDSKGIFAFTLPVFYSFNNLNNDNNYNYYNGPNYNNENNDPAQMLYFYPGFKIYPGGKGRFRYGIGPNIVIGTGNHYQTSEVYDQSGNYIYTTNGLRDRFVLGIMITNSLNINPSEHLYLGLDFGLGITYLNRIDSRNKTADGLAKFGFNIGYRF